MTTLPIDDEIAAVVNQLQAKEVFERLRDFMFESLGGGPETEITIAGGAVTPLSATHTIDTEADAAADDLDTINQANHGEGRYLWLRCANAARVVTIRHNQGAGGKVLLSDGVNFILNSTKKVLVLKRVGTTWEEVDRFYGDKLEEMRAWLQVEPDTVSTAADRNITAADRGKVITLTGATPRTFTFTATPAQLGDGWECVFRNASTADLTVTPASGTIDGKSTYVLRPGETIRSRSDATNLDLTAARLLWREILTANRTYNVATTGNDTTGNGSAGAPWATPQRAANFIRDALDLNGWAITVQHADGTYTGGLLMRPAVGQRSEQDIVFQGNAANNAAVVFHTTGFNAIEARAGGRMTVKDIKVQTTTSGHCCRSIFPGSMLICRNLNYGPCASSHNVASYQGYMALNINDPYSISGGATHHLWALNGGLIDSQTNSTVTITGGPTFTGEFAKAEASGSHITASGTTYSGAVTGKRYEAEVNGTIQTNGAGPNYFPGTIAGTTATGGQYL